MRPATQREERLGSGRKVDTRPRSRPDPRPARLMVSGGAVAALSLILAGLVRLPTAAETTNATQADRPAAEAKVKLERRVRYVRLKPGQNAPPGARVIEEAASKPRVVVKYVATPSQRTTRAPVVRTRQSGG
jgi:hypothetical protein